MRPALRAALVCVLLSATLVACSRGESPEPTLKSFLDGWRSGKLDNVGFVTPAGQGVPAASVVQEIKDVSSELAGPNLKITKKPKVTKDLASAEITVAWPLGKDLAWEYTSPVQLARDNGKWRMVWSASVIHPQLTSGDQLITQRVAGTRGSILDGSGKPIFEPGTVVVVGVQPSEIKDLTKLIADMDAAFKSIPKTVVMTDLPARVAAAKPEAFVEVITLREADYLKIKPRIHPLAGTKFRTETWQLPPTTDFARSLLGSVGEVTKEIMDANPDKYVVGDQVGLAGLQRKYDDRLLGTPGVTVSLTRKAAEGTVNKTQLWQSPPKPGTPIKTTLDPRVQNAADAALRGLTKRTALVAVRVSDAAVLAVSNGPTFDGDNLALTAQVPPGSTFKMVSALGLLDSGTITPATVVNCPQTLTVEGATFHNSNNFALGAVQFHVDFAKSCNTAFASLADRLGDNGLADAGKSVGLGVPWDLGVDAFSGKVSAGGSKSERAAATFGQGTTLVSPIGLAGATAAVAHGSWQQPKLVLDPAPAKPAPAGAPLKQSTVAALQAMMAEVVSGGTAMSIKDVPGVRGKTGTAEFDSADPNKTHAWFVGWQGDIAFAVFVENGGGGSAVALPLAETFLRNLARA